MTTLRSLLLFALIFIIGNGSFSYCIESSSFQKPRFNHYDDGPVDYSQHKLIRIVPKSKSQIRLLQNFEDKFELDFWSPVVLNRPLLMLIDPQRSEIFKFFNGSTIQYDVLSENFQSILDQEKQTIQSRRYLRSRDDEFDFSNYHSIEEITDQLNDLEKKYSDKTKRFSVGQTYEKRDIPGIRIGNPDGKKIIVECGIHAREWIAQAFGTWLATQLLTNENMATFIGKYEFIIVPALNVDGYVYTKTNRMWRKTRSRQSGTSCVGADPNRNWDSAWCQRGSSTNPCSETYCGRAAFSEVEAKQMADLIEKEKKGDVLAYFAVHSYSQLWMFPYGYTYDKVPNYDQLQTVSNAAVAAIKSVHGKTFVAGPIASTIYLASGSSIDYAYDKDLVKNAFALELRDTGEYGFILPPEQIIPSCEETWAGLKAAIESIEKL